MFADQLFVDDPAWSFAQGERANDDSANGIIQQTGGRHAVLWGGGATNFVGIDSLEWYVRYALIHEIGHVLGAVQDSAGNSTGSAHCNDQFDVMCYADGGLRSNVFEVCGSAATAWDLRPLDCNRDDYADPAPVAGSYLDTHWNIARSDFLCAGVCIRPATAPIARLVEQRHGAVETGGRGGARRIGQFGPRRVDHGVRVRPRR